MSEMKDIEILEKIKAILTNCIDLIEEEDSDEFNTNIVNAEKLLEKFKNNEEKEEDLGEDEEKDIENAEELLTLLDASQGSDDWSNAQGYIEDALEIVDELIESESGEEDEEKEEKEEDGEGEDEDEE